MARKINKNNTDRRLHDVKQMPPLFHKYPDQKFNREQSQVFQWLGQNINLLDYVFDFLNRHKLIKYDSETGKWQGADYDTTED